INWKAILGKIGKAAAAVI
uniref:Communis-AAAA n=1 Tax=Chartergellus communis TaxID=743411 RepID=MAST_CHACK|nr:RecName: Full=Communis-AAAA; Contains: RecName: Full=Communis [Chartergellus communis]